MSQELINLNSDLVQLRNEGYHLELKEGYALVHSVPYVNSQQEIQYGTLLSALGLSGNKTLRPDTHVIYFIGDHPCNRDGSILIGIQHITSNQELIKGIVSNHSFSNKPTNGYNNYYEKFTRYIDIIMAPAKSLNPEVTAQVFHPVLDTSEASLFHYVDTNSSRANIGVLSEKFKNQKIGIIGLGGTGSYVLDFVAKTPVAEIHLFDGDEFLQHNAFRAPGAPSLDQLDEKKKKTIYFSEIYKKMHKNIFPHTDFISSENTGGLLNLDFIFLCMDNGNAKKEIVEPLLKNGIPFIDVGIDVKNVDNVLIGDVRTTTVTPDKNDHLYYRISFAETDDNAYSSNIQIAELNALNATFAVIKWKKQLGFYQDIYKQHHTIYNTNTGVIVNAD